MHKIKGLRQIVPSGILLFSHALMLGVALFGGQNARADKIQLLADPWCPFTCDPNSSRPGVLVEVATAALALAGHSVEYKESSWSRAILEARENRATGIPGAIKSDAPDFIYPKTWWAQEESCFFVLENSKWKYKGVDSLKGQRLGLASDYTYGQPLDDYISKNKSNSAAIDYISGVDVTFRMLKKLLDSRIDVMIEENSVTNFVMKSKAEIPAEKIKRAGCLKSTPLYVAFSPKNPRSKKYAEDLDRGVRTLRENGQLTNILRHYGL